MPRIQQLNVIDISLEKFLNACSEIELMELELLLSSSKYQNRIQAHRDAVPEYADQPKNDLEIIIAEEQC